MQSQMLLVEADASSQLWLVIWTVSANQLTFQLYSIRTDSCWLCLRSSCLLLNWRGSVWTGLHTARQYKFFSQSWDGNTESWILKKKKYTMTKSHHFVLHGRQSISKTLRLGVNKMEYWRKVDKFEGCSQFS